MLYPGEYNEFDLNEFFRSKKDKNKKLEEISFDHEEFVQKWIYHIRDQYNETENNFNPHKKRDFHLPINHLSHI